MLPVKDPKNEQLASELAGLRQKVAELEELENKHKRLEEALQEVLRKIFESATNGIQITDFDDIVTRDKPKNK